MKSNSGVNLSISYKNNPHFCILLTEGSILQSLQEGGLTLYKVVHAILSNIRTTTWGLDYYQKTLTMQKPLCSCGWCIYNHHNKSKVMNISCIHSDYRWLKFTYLISVWNISAPFIALSLKYYKCYIYNLSSPNNNHLFNVSWKNFAPLYLHDINRIIINENA